MHTLGLAGNYVIPQHLQNTLKDFGLSVKHMGESAYKVESSHADMDIDAICPPTIERNGNIFDLKNLKKLSAFLHQPIRTTIESQQPKVEESGLRARRRNAKQQAVKAHAQRTSIHRLLRFATAGSVEIPPDKEQQLNKDIEECHAQTEEAIRKADTWKSERELANTTTKISSIPNTTFNAATGFTIKIADQAQFESANQQTLDTFLWQAIERATGEKYTQRPSSITLTSQQLENLYKLANTPELAELIEAVEFDEMVLAKTHAINTHVKTLSTSPLLNAAAPKKQHLMDVMKATSALTSIVNAAFMRDAWARHNFTARHASPLEGLEKEMRAFIAVADQYSKNDEITSVQMEAIAQEFYSLLSFSAHIIDALDRGLEKQELKNPDRDDIPALREYYQSLKPTFETASIAGVNLDPKFLSDEQRDMLKTMQRHAGRPETVWSKTKSAAKAPIKAGGESFVDFAGDVINFIREDPKIATAFVGLATALIVSKGGDSAAVQAAAAYDTALEISDSGDFMEVVANGSNVPKDVFGNDNFHWDLKFSVQEGYYMYKHMADSNFISGPTLQFMEYIRSNVHSAYLAAGIEPNLESGFDTAANAVVNPIADKLFAVNVFQNASHAAFWMWAANRGYEHGLGGFTKIFDLSAPVTDLAVRAGASTRDLVLRRKLDLSAQLKGAMDNKSNAHLNDQPQYDTVLQNDALLPSFPAGATSVPHTLKIDAWNTQKTTDAHTCDFTIHESNFQPTLMALHIFEHKMKHAKEAYAAHESWHLKPLLQRIKNLKEALARFSEEPNDVALKKSLDDNLEYIIASDLRYSGDKSSVFEAVFDKAPDALTHKRLMRSANTTIGKEKRKNRVQEIRAEMRGEIPRENDKPIKLTSHFAAAVKIGAINAINGVVKTAKTVRRGMDRVINKRNVALGLTAAGVSSGLDLAIVDKNFFDTLSYATATGVLGSTLLAKSNLVKKIDQDILLKAGATGLTIAATCAGIDALQAGDQVVETVGAATGGTVAGSTTVATFLNFNFWEDIVGVHIGTGLSLVFGGAVAGATYKGVTRPLLASACETKPGMMMKSAWKKSAGALGSVATHIYEGIDKKNTQWGQALTRRAVQPG